MSFVYIAAAVVLGTAAQLFLKAGTNAAPVDFRLALEPRILAGIACYAVSLVVWILALSKTPVSVAYPMVSIGFALNAAPQVPALTRTIPGYTTETVNFTNLSGHALSAVQLGQAMTLNWSLPVTFPIAKVEIYGLEYASSGSSYVSCEFKPTTPLAVTSTSVTLTPPTTCNGSPIASVPQPGPSAIQINVSVTGTHGEMASAWWPFN